MSDTTYNVYQHHGTAAERAAFVPDPPLGKQPIYIWYEDDTNNVYFYTTAWHGPFAASGGAPTLHAPTHSSAGADPVTLTNLAGFPGGTATFLRADATFAAPSATVNRRQITVIIDGGGVVITAGLKVFISLPVAGTWKKWRILSADPLALSGSIVLDVWKAAYASYPPVIGGTIVAAAKPTISGATKAEDTGLTGWTLAFAAGDVIAVNVDSAATFTKVAFMMEFE